MPAISVLKFKCTWISELLAFI